MFQQGEKFWGPHYVFNHSHYLIDVKISLGRRDKNSFQLKEFL